MSKHRKRQVRFELEKVCPRCGGAGGSNRDYQNVWDNCVQCGGSGHINTAIGDRIVSLMQHNLKPLLIKVAGEMLAGK
jgi:DnaJ-class molecular chaperone